MAERDDRDDDGSAARVVQLGDTEVAGESLRRLILGSNHRRIQVVGGVVRGELDLSSVRVGRPVELVGTTFTDVVDLSGSSLPRFRLIECLLEQGCNANGAVVAGDFDLGGSTIRGALTTTASASRPAALWLTDTRIGGRLLAAGTVIEADDATTAAHQPLADTVRGSVVAGAPPDRRGATRAIQGDRLQVGGNIRLIGGFRARGEIRLIGAEIGGSVDLVSCRLEADDAALDLSSATIGGSLFVVPGDGGPAPTIDGRLDLENLTVEGQTLAVGATFRARGPAETYYRRFEPGDRRVAVRAPGARFQGEVNLAEGCRLEGRLNLRGATFGGRFDLHDTAFAFPTGYALDLSNATVGGDLEVEGRSRSIRMVNATVRGSLVANGLVIEASDDLTKALSGRGLTVGGELQLAGADVSGGTVDLRRIRVGGDVNLGGARLASPVDQSLALSSAHLDGGVYLDRGFRAEGTVRLSRASVTGQLRCQGSFRSGRSPNGPTPAVEAELLTATGGMVLLWEVDGIVDLSDATTTVLADRPDGWGRHYLIGGLSYDRFAGIDATEPATDTDPAARIRWLVGQSGLDTSSFQELADYYRRYGRTVDAERVVIARNRALRARRAEAGGLGNLVRNLVDRVWDLSIGYGYRAGRAGGFLLALLVLTAGVLSLPQTEEIMRTVDEDNVSYSPAGPLVDGEPAPGADGARCGGGRVRCFDPVFYAVDTVVPLVDLHQRSTWYPDRELPHGRLYQWGLDTALLLGWAGSSALVLGLTHAIGPGRR